MATLKIERANPTAVDADVLVMAVVSTPDGPALVRELAGIQPAAARSLLELIGLTGARDEFRLIPAPDGVHSGAVALVGIGDVATADDPVSLREAAGAALRAISGKPHVAIAFPCEHENGVLATAEGAMLGTYAFTRYRGRGSSAPAVPVDTVTVLVEHGEHADEIRRIEAETEAVFRARDMVNTAPADQSPADLADHVVTLAQELPISVEVRDERRLAEDGCGGILAVGGGSARPPRLVRMDYAPAGADVHLALVGKGIVFDAGGLSLKEPDGMGDMKADMAGAAAVAAVVLAAARLRLRVRITGWLALAENMPSGSAYRPSDVLTLRSGHTVEVLNTDAEGRLVLADTLALAAEEGPDCIVDLATLTGTQPAALGGRIAGLMSNDDALTERLHRLGDLTGERMWPMPLPSYLLGAFRSDVADLTNVSAIGVGMLAASVFLQQFVTGPDQAPVPWAHLDVQGPAYNTHEAWGFTPVGGTGYPVRTLLALAAELGSPTV